MINRRCADSMSGYKLRGLLSPCRQLKPASTLTACTQHQRSSRRRGHASISKPGKEIAVLGGGLTGLTAAYYLAKRLPASTNITIYESSDRLGGWVRTEKVDVDVGDVQGTVQFERGPRTLSSLAASTNRFDDLVLYDLALDLGLRLENPLDQPRHIYYPNRLVTLPPHSSVVSCLKEPLFISAIPAVLGMLYRRTFELSRTRNDINIDFSIADWLRRISWGNALGNNFASAMIHGIYGGDIGKLSARAVLGDAVRAWYLPKLPPTHKYVSSEEERVMKELGRLEEVRKMAWKAKGTLLHFGEKGMESLPRGIADALAMQDNIKVHLNEPVSGIEYDKETGKVMIEGPSTGAASYDKVISTIPPATMNSVTSSPLPHLAVPAVSIMTVNIFYPIPDLKPPGFGYLIPRSVPEHQNPHRALGVFFDSDVGVRGKDEPAGTKLFVLFGGHYYDNMKPPTEEEAIENAKQLLESHLGIPSSTPCFAMARFAENCIPQHHVGHFNSMHAAHSELKEHFGGKLAVAGGWYTRIGAMGALRAGYDAAQSVARGEMENTGLESYREGGEVKAVSRADIKVRRSQYVLPPKGME